jgi:hypothetical protein
MVRHGLDLGRITECIWDVGSDVVSGSNPGKGWFQGRRVQQVTLHRLRGTDRQQFVDLFRAPGQGSGAHSPRDQGSNDSLTGLAARSRDQGHGLFIRPAL